MLDELGTQPSTRAPEEMGEARRHLLAPHREHAEVVEVVFAQMEVRELGWPHHEQEWSEGDVAGPYQPAQREGAVASGSAHTTAPAQPSSGSSVSACSGRATAFQG